MRELTLAFFFSLLVVIGSLMTTQVAAPPLQPAAGPGGKEYRHESVRVGFFGRGAEGYWLFEPDNPRPERAPVVILLHGWGAWDPEPYRRWIDHLVRRGNVIIYPRYQEAFNSDPAGMTAAAQAAVEDAWRRLHDPDGRHVSPDGEKVVIIGHSLGAVLAANLAARASSDAGSGLFRLPSVAALLLIEPGDSEGRYAGRDYPSIMELSHYHEISPETLLLLVVGDRPEALVVSTAREMWLAFAHIPDANKDFVIVQSDDHGRPALVADHFSPCAAGRGFSPMLEAALGDFETDALDYFGYWKLADALIGAVYYGKDREYALGNTEQQRFMGRWSDGTPVRPLIITDTPDFSAFGANREDP
ncbi:MAG: alpha/beta hydrolase fold domain-containing protein [Limnochordales bacterium]|nr:alpha/beta hydrolase fold domain-containing protein [Limnochordales bacterium]